MKKKILKIARNISNWFKNFTLKKLLTLIISSGVTALIIILITISLAERSRMNRFIEDVKEIVTVNEIKLLNKELFGYEDNVPKENEYILIDIQTIPFENKTDFWQGKLLLLNSGKSYEYFIFVTDGIYMICGINFNEITHQDVTKEGGCPDIPQETFSLDKNNNIIAGNDFKNISDVEVDIPINSLKNIVQIAASANHTMALLRDGTVWAWGDNTRNQLGNEIFNFSLVPVQVMRNANTPLTNVKQIATGPTHALALLRDGTVWGWGDNNFGRLGDGTGTNRIYPVQVMKAANDPLINVDQIIAGDTHTLALLKDGTLWSWGDNFFGQLGNGTTINSIFPVQVMRNARSPLRNIKQIAAGSQYTKAILADGTVWGWGRNNFGQLGNGTETNSVYPTRVMRNRNNALENVVQISTSYASVLAILRDGTIWGWGRNNSSQLADGTTAQKRHFPVQVRRNLTVNLTNAKQIAVGTNHTLAILADESLWGWGNNFFGQLGDGTKSNQRFSHQVKLYPNMPLINVAQVVVGENHTVALKNNGTLWTWGNNDFGQLGDGTILARGYPVLIVIPNK